MSGRIGLQYPGAFEGGSDVLSEIDRALALIGAAHWMEKYRPHPLDRPQSTSINRPLWGETVGKRVG